MGKAPHSTRISLHRLDFLVRLGLCIQVPIRRNVDEVPVRVATLCEPVTICERFNPACRSLYGSSREGNDILGVNTPGERYSAPKVRNATAWGQRPR